MAGTPRAAATAATEVSLGGLVVDVGPVDRPHAVRPCRARRAGRSRRRPGPRARAGAGAPARRGRPAGPASGGRRPRRRPGGTAAGARCRGGSRGCRSTARRPAPRCRGPRPRRRSSRRSTWRHTSGSWSGWLRFTLTVRPDRRARSAIHGHSWTGTRAWSGANWNTPWPARASASPMASSSSGAASVPGTSSPSFDRCSGVRLVENPSAPAPQRLLAPARPSRRASSVGRRLVGGAPLAHHEGAQRSVGDLGTDVDHLRAAARRRRGTRGSSSTPT